MNTFFKMIHFQHKRQMALLFPDQEKLLQQVHVRPVLFINSNSKIPQMEHCLCLTYIIYDIKNQLV